MSQSMSDSSSIEEGTRSIDGRGRRFRRRPSVRRVTRAGSLGTILTVPLTFAVAAAVVAPAAVTAAPLDERGYELVSPVPTGGIPISPSQDVVFPSEDGNLVTFGSLIPLPGTHLSPPDDQHGQASGSEWRYIAIRGSDGWNLEENGFMRQSLADLGVGQGGGPSGDAKRFLTTTNAGLDPDDQNGHVDLYQRQPDGSVIWISRDPRIPAGSPQTAPGTVSAGNLPAYDFYGPTMSVDGRTVLLNSQRQLTDDDTVPGIQNRLYKWQDGVLAFIGKRPDGSVPTGSNDTSGASFLANTLPTTGGTAATGAVARDGSRVVFAAHRTDASQSGYALYVQTDGQPTLEATKGSGVPSLPASEPFSLSFLGASGSASRILFTSASRLTTDSGAGASSGGEADLYVYDADADKLRDLTPRLDGVNDPNINPTVANRGRARGLAAVSEDGKTVYFVADAQYPTPPNPEGATPSASGRNLYMARLDGIDDPIQLRFIGALSSSDDRVWQRTMINGSGEGKRAYASPGGSVLGFGSYQPLTGDPLGGTEQLFVYDADADALDCASCPSSGPAPTGNVNPPLSDPQLAGTYWQGDEQVKRWVSTSGSVFFYTATPLLPADHNQVDDVYEYREGQLRLISTGVGNRGSRFENASRDGSTVFFNTFEALVPQDDEPGIPKLYAARVGGGFAASSPEPSCEGEECRGESASPPASISVGSVSFLGDGNVASEPSVAVSRLKAVVGSAARLRVRVPGAGRISVAGSSVRRANRSAPKAGTYSVRIALSSKARRALRKRKKLRINVRVSYRAKSGQSVSKTVKVTFKRPKAKPTKTWKERGDS